jgi:hypothetical protein
LTFFQLSKQSARPKAKIRTGGASVKGATVVKVLVLAGLFVAGQSLITPRVSLATPVDSYDKDGRHFICIMQGTLKYCGNWNVTT